MSLKANIKHQRVPVPGGGDDERYLLLVGVENDGEQDATDFRLDVEIPAHFLDEAGHKLRVEDARPGFARFQIKNSDEPCRLEHFYPGDRTKDLIAFHCAIRGRTKRQEPELLDQEIIATVFSGSMKPKKTVMTVSELMMAA